MITVIKCIWFEVNSSDCYWVHFTASYLANDDI